MNILTVAHQTTIILLALIGIGFLIGFHEFGHFIFCKIFNIRTPSFSIGFGPRLIEKKIGDTNFVLSAIPLGGYVEIAGAQEVGQGEQKEARSTDQYSFARKPYYQKMLVIAGGILFNLIFAYVTLIVLLAIGIPKTPLLRPYNITNAVQDVSPETPAAQAGLQAGDIITKIENTPVSDSNMQEFMQVLAQQAGKPTTFIVKRADTELPITTTLRDLASNQRIFGVDFFLKDIPAQPLTTAISMGIEVVNTWIAGTFQGIKGMFVKKSLHGLGGPVGIVSNTLKNVQSDGIQALFIMLCLISVGLAVFNIIPLPIFDGGQALFYTLEAITGRSLDSARIYIHYVSWVLVMMLMIYVTCKDIFNICK